MEKSFINNKKKWNNIKIYIKSRSLEYFKLNQFKTHMCLKFGEFLRIYDSKCIPEVSNAAENYELDKSFI